MKTTTNEVENKSLSTGFLKSYDRLKHGIGYSDYTFPTFAKLSLVLDLKSFNSIEEVIFMIAGMNQTA